MPFCTDIKFFYYSMSLTGINITVWFVNWVSVWPLTSSAAPLSTPVRLHRHCPHRCPLSCCLTRPSCSSSAASLCVCASYVSSSAKQNSESRIAARGQKSERCFTKQGTLLALFLLLHLLFLLVFVLLLVLMFLLFALLAGFLLFPGGAEGGGTSSDWTGEQTGKVWSTSSFRSTKTHVHHILRILWLHSFSFSYLFELSGCNFLHFSFSQQISLKK